MSGAWYYDWSKNLVKDPKLIPETPHYAVLVFKDHTYMSPGYDKGDPDYSSTLKIVDYYAFSDRSTWEKMISQIYAERSRQKSYQNDNDEVVFYHCSGRGKVSVKVEVNVPVDEKPYTGHRDGYDPYEGNRG